MKTALYLFKHTAKAELESIQPLAQYYAKQLGGTGLSTYADGWESHPAGWDELVADALNGNVEMVVALNLTKWHGKEDVFVKDIKQLMDNGVVFAVAQAPFLGVIKNQGNLTAARIVLRAEVYYKNIHSLSTQQGMKNKKPGRAPFGLQYKGGNLVINPETYPTVCAIMSLLEEGLSYPEIMKKTGLTYAKVYNTSVYWGGKDWRNPTSLADSRGWTFEQ